MPIEANSAACSLLVIGVIIDAMNHMVQDILCNSQWQLYSLANSTSETNFVK